MARGWALRLLTVCVLLTGLARGTAVAPPPSEEVRRLWVLHKEPLDAAGETARFHVYWRLNAGGGAECGGQGGAEAALRCRREALGPSRAARARTKEWLRPAGDACTFAWNAVHCRGVPVAVAQRLFGLPEGALQAWCRREDCSAEGELRASGAAASEYRHVATATAGLHVPAGCGVEQVTGLTLSDYKRKAGRHMGRSRPASARRGAAAGGAAMPVAAAASGTPPYTYTPVFEGNFGAWTSSEPLLLGVDTTAVTFMVKCQQGSFLNYTTSGCQAAGDVAPTSVSFSFASVDGPPVSFQIAATPLQNITSAPASSMLASDEVSGSVPSWVDPQFPALSSSTVFFLASPLAQLEGFNAWTRYEANITAIYPDGTQLQGGATAFYDTATFVSGATTLNGAVLSTRPTIRYTVPDASFVGPGDVRQLYGVPADMSASGEVAGVVELTSTAAPGQGLLMSDIQSFATHFALPQPTVAIIGDSSIVSQQETTLDVEMLTGVAQGVAAYVYCISYGTSGDYAGYTDALEGFASTAAGGTSTVNFTLGLSTVWSISYGGPEWFDGGAPDPQMLRVNTLFEALTGAGITVTASSGDSGAWYVTGTTVSFGPNWPASSPYVVGVGATLTVLSSEVVCSAADTSVITSGGGFSAAPSWQAGLNTGSAYRGVPDVASLGSFIYGIISGTPEEMFGTSAASPIFASMVVMMNKQLGGGLANLTQLVSTLPSAAFTDITSGNNCVGEHGASPLANNYPIDPGVPWVEPS